MMIDKSDGQRLTTFTCQIPTADVDLMQAAVNALNDPDLRVRLEMALMDQALPENESSAIDWQALAPF